MFTRIGAAALKADLSNTIELCAALDNPEQKFKSIHVAGTNGKGSTSHILAAVLQAQGYKTGLYTSPHLKDFRERILINGKKIGKQQVTKFVNEQKLLIEQLEPSFFEVTVAMAFDYFANEQVDIAIIEVGLGGRLDSTNVITPEVSVITNISLDHTNLLGSTVQEIAPEKAGIIKQRIPVVIGETQKSIKDIFEEKAKTLNAPIFFADEKLFLKNKKLIRGKLQFSVYEEDKLLFGNLSCDLTGSYQEKNILTVIKAISILNSQNIFLVEPKAIYTGLANVKKLTHLQGRWQILQKNPLVICDTGHNLAGIQEVLKNINQTKFEKLHIVFGMVKDKSIDEILALLPKTACYYFCSPNIERGLDACALMKQASQFELTGKAYPSVADAKAAALLAAQNQDFIFIGGSTFVVAEALP
ncbi:dihydrofolate synthase/folylpolyglutamate synthase [Pedobacter sp. UYP30]|uniref:bifunctional folylpolyglutamate synthase/dihydrofolate synthase n=1 Tax=Pedobacter sp. UYP30 TaxID=1756400 RepID=UPI003395C786